MTDCVSNCTYLECRGEFFSELHKITDGYGCAVSGAFCLKAGSFSLVTVWVDTTTTIKEMGCNIFLNLTDLKEVLHFMGSCK